LRAFNKIMVIFGETMNFYIRLDIYICTYVKAAW